MTSKKRSKVRIAIGLLSVVVVVGAVMLGVGLYFYLTDPARKTTVPESTGLLRTVTDGVLVSPEAPALTITFDERCTYLGGHQFILYGTAAVEQHIFIEMHADGSLKTFYWIQFEAFLPDNDFTYDYSSSPQRLEIDGLEFYTDTEPGKTSRYFQLGNPGTDGYWARKFAADRGYEIPDDYFYARLVHLPDLDRRTELLIIVMDDLAPMGLTAEELRDGGAQHDRWPEIEAAYLERIRQAIQFSRP